MDVLRASLFGPLTQSLALLWLCPAQGCLCVLLTVSHGVCTPDPCCPQVCAPKTRSGGHDPGPMLPFLFTLFTPGRLPCCIAEGTQQSSPRRNGFQAAREEENKLTGTEPDKLHANVLCQPAPCSLCARVCYVLCPHSLPSHHV